MVAGAEVARLVTDFKSDIGIIKQRKKNVDNKKHHEQTKSIQKAFKKQVDELYQVFEDRGSPFFEISKDLVKIDTRDIIDDSVK